VTGATGTVGGSTGASGTDTAVADGQLLATAKPISVRTPADDPAWALVLVGLALALVVFAPPAVALVLRRRRAG
jgi:hypothetical protein